MEENSETVLIAVDTSFDTNLVVFPPRTATIADVREKIKEGHMALYPSYGIINIRAVKVELFNRHYLLEESHKVGQIFRGWQGCLLVELAGYPPSSTSASRLRLPLISTEDKFRVSPSNIRKDPLPGDGEQDGRPGNSLDRGPPQIPVQPEIILLGQRISESSPNRTVASEALEVVGTQKSSDGRNNSERSFRTGSQEVVLHRKAGADRQGIGTDEAELDMELDALLDVGSERPANVGRSRDLASSGRNVASKDIFGGAQASTQSSPGKVAGSKAQFSGDRLSGERKRKAGVSLNLTGSQDVPADPVISSDLQKQVGGSSTKKNRIRGKSNKSPVKIDESLMKAIPEFSDKIVDDKKADVAVPNDVSSSESGPNSVVRQEVGGSSRQKGGSDLPSGTEIPKDRTDSIWGKSAEKVVVEDRQVGKPQAKLRSEAIKSHSSGISTSEKSSEEGEGKEPMAGNERDANPILKVPEAQNESSDESNRSEESSESYRPEGSAGTRDVDEVVNKLVDLYSPIISDESGGEESSDASEERQPKGLRRRVSSNAVDEAENAAERNNRRSSRTTAGLNKFQHFIDSQDGLDQLLGLTLNQRKSEPSSDLDPQLPTAKRRPLPFDGLSIDVVPDTQVGNANFDASAHREVYAEEMVHGKKTTGRGLDDGVHKPVQGGSPDMLPSGKDEKKSSKSKSKEMTLSADANDDPSDSLKNFASIASESARKLDSNEDLLQPKSDDSQQFQAAVQLTRLAMADEEDDAESDPMQSPKDSSVEKKKKKKKVKPDASNATSRENDLPGNIENSEGIDPTRSGLATASSNLKIESPSLRAEHPQEVGIERAGKDRSMLGIAEQSTDHSLEKNEDEVNAVMEAIATSARKLEEEDVEQQAEKERFTELASVAEDSEPVDRNQDGNEFAVPGKAVEEKKLSARKIREERSAREKEHELNITGRGDEEPTVTADKTMDVPYVEDSPGKECRMGAERQDGPSNVGGGSAEKSERNRRVKKGNRPADSPENVRREERSSRSLLKENGEWIDIGSEKIQSVLERLEAEEGGADDGLAAKNEMGAMNPSQKRKRKKQKTDGESLSLGREFADEVFAKVRQIHSDSILSSYPSSAQGGSIHKTVTSGPTYENLALPEGSSHRDEETPVKPPVSKKKKKSKTPGSQEHTAEVTDAEVEVWQKGMYHPASDVEAVIPVSEFGHTKPPRPRKAGGTKHISTSAEKVIVSTPEAVVEEAVQSEQPEKYSTEKYSKEVGRRKLAEEEEFADLRSKDGILAPKTAVSTEEDLSKKVTSPVKKKKKKKTITGIEEDSLLGVQNINSRAREQPSEVNEGKGYVGTIENVREGDKTDTPTKKKRKKVGILSAADEENDEALEPSCNQLGYRASGLSELNIDVSRNFNAVDDVFLDDRSTEGHTKSKKKRDKGMLSDVEKIANASSPALEHPGSRTPKPKKRKQVKNQEFNVDAGATVQTLSRGADRRLVESRKIPPSTATKKRPLRGASGRFVTPEKIPAEEVERRRVKVRS